MPRGGQRGYGNAGRSAYAGSSSGGQSRAVAVTPNGRLATIPTANGSIEIVTSGGEPVTVGN